MTWLLLEIGVEVFDGLPLRKDFGFVIELAALDELVVPSFNWVPACCILA